MFWLKESLNNNNIQYPPFICTHEIQVGMKTEATCQFIPSDYIANDNLEFLTHYICVKTFEGLEIRTQQW